MDNVTTPMNEIATVNTVTHVTEAAMKAGISFKLYHNGRRRMFFINAYGGDAVKLHGLFPTVAKLTDEPHPERPTQNAKITIAY